MTSDSASTEFDSFLSLPQDRHCIRLSPDELRRACINFISAWASTAGQEWGFLEMNLRPAVDVSQQGDPAVWGDWLAAVWGVRGIRSTADSQFPGNRRHAIVDVLSDSGQAGQALTRKYEDSIFTFELSQATTSAGSLCLGETAGFMVLQSFVSWTAWPSYVSLGYRSQLELTTEHLIYWLNSLAEGRAPRYFANLWGPFFVSDFSQIRDDVTPSIASLIPGRWEQQGRPPFGD